MRRNLPLVLLVGLLVVAVVAVVVARRTDPETVATAAGTPGAPATEAKADGASGPLDAADLPIEAQRAPAVEAQRWLNSDPLAPADLTGKVVLYEFWTFGCINCQHVLPHVKAWHERYARDGLVVLSIHTPEFDYEADPEQVAGFVHDEHITYPVALDPEKATWRAFGNRYWPAFYLHDQQGRRRLTHFGEGAYDEMENAIRALLRVDPASPRAVVEP